MPPSVIGYVWNAVAGRFIGPGGQFVSLSTVRSTLDVALRHASSDAADIARAYASGSIGLTEFENQMRQLIKDTQIYSVAVSAGGFSSIGVPELSFMSQRIAEQFAYLSNWTQQLASDAPRARAGMAARAAMYPQSARNSYDVNYRAGQVDRGLEQERSIRNPGESCDVCIEQEALGWVPIGTLIPIGERTCLGNCNCDIEYR